ncbi:unnamed protein product [Toxocara canis]|uniref:Paired domain-containing protein n=1 Tax=Toxocara canis TaxID=6265 RepID=A0A183UQ11_TOXCA|nr:unnamed protein product [Toxocara canis]
MAVDTRAITFTNIMGQLCWSMMSAIAEHFPQLLAFMKCYPCPHLQTGQTKRVTLQGRVNQLGGVFINGRPLPQHIRMKIIEMATNGVKPCHISRQLRVSHGCVSKILYRYAETGSVSPGQIGGNMRSRMAKIAIEDRIKRLCREHPSMHANEIRSYLIENEYCSRMNAPTLSAIHRYLRSSSARRSTSHSKKRPLLKHSIDDILNKEQDEHRISGEDAADNSSRARRNRTSFSPEQLEVLEAAFNANTYPDQEFRERIAAATKLEESKIQVRKIRMREIQATFSTFATRIL